MPATLLGHLAVDQSLRGKDIGEHLLTDALRPGIEALSRRGVSRCRRRRER